MKGITRMIPRVPQQVKHMLNKNQDENDIEFKTLEDKVENINTNIKNLINDTEKFKKNVENMIKRQEEFGMTMLELHKPIVTDSPLSSNEDISTQKTNSYKSTENTRNIELYLEKTKLMNEQIFPHLENVNTHVLVPIKKYNDSIQSIKRVIKKRSHKLLDYERHKQSLEKLHEKQNRSLEDERKISKTNESFSVSEGEFKMYDEQLRSQLPIFFNYSTQLFDSCLITFYNVQKDIYHIMYVYFYELANECGINLEADIVQQYESYNCSSLLEQAKIDNLKTFITASSSINKRNSFGPSSTTISSSNSVNVNSSQIEDLPPYSCTSSSSNPPPYKRNSFEFNKNQQIGRGNSYGGGVSSNSYSETPQKHPKPAPPIPVKNVNLVTALYDFTAQGPGDISFKRGDKIEIISKTQNNNEWWTGKINGRIGQFPGNYVE